MQFAAAGVRGAWRDREVRPAPLPWPSIAGTVRPTGGKQVVVLAAPGVGKTIFALQWAAQSRVRTLYCSADTDAKDLTARMASLATGHDVGLVESRLEGDGGWSTAYTDAVAASFPHIVTDYSSSPRLDVVAEKAEALCDVWGEPPGMIVLDTASDIARAGEGYESWEQGVWLPCRDLARYFNCVIVLPHHVKEGAAASGNIPLTLNAGQYKPEKFAEIVLGMYRSSGDEVTVQVLKNRGGRNNVPFPLRADLERSRLLEPL